MAYWYRWQSADGTVGQRSGPIPDRSTAKAALLDRLRAEADELEYGTGVAGVWTSDGALWRDDYDILLGRYIIEQDTTDQ